MGCGCGRSNVASVQKSRAIQPAQAVTPKTVSSAVCIEKYDLLASLDRKLIALHKKFRFVGGVSKRYADLQKVIRGWITELKDKCPDADELSSYAEYINKEYSKYFTA